MNYYDLFCLIINNNKKNLKDKMIEESYFIL